MVTGLQEFQLVERERKRNPALAEFAPKANAQMGKAIRVLGQGPAGHTRGEIFLIGNFPILDFHAIMVQCG